MSRLRHSNKKRSMDVREKISNGMKKYVERLSPKETKRWKDASKTGSAKLKSAIANDKRYGAGFIYIVAASAVPGWYKVGVGNIGRRMRDARTWLPGKVRLIGYAHVDKPYETEYHVHHQYTNDGEWVRATPRTLRRYIKRLTGVDVMSGYDLDAPFREDVTEHSHDLPSRPPSLPLP